jgi:hypothetical protein
MQSVSKNIAVIDFETDPFERLKVPEAFACGWFDGKEYHQIWSDKQRDVLLWALKKCKNFDGIIYAHNGGKFDFLEYLFAVGGKVLIGESVEMRGSRIVRVKFGKAELRDSYAILPAPLKSYDKGDIDYKLFKRGIRDKHRIKICKYMRRDCMSLHALVLQFIGIHGLVPLTAAAAGMRHLKSLGYKVDSLGVDLDAKFRKFYYGGRCQARKKGIFHGHFYVYDIKSAYPYAMLKQHAFGREFDFIVRPRKVLPQDFVMFRGSVKDGVFPERTKAGLFFRKGKGDYFVTGWEYLEAKRQKLIKGVVVYVERARVLSDFGRYVNYWFAVKEEAERKGDRAGRLIAKIMLNAVYGKFAQRPDKHREFLIVNADAENPEQYGYEEEYVNEERGFAVWSTKSKRPPTYYNVATAGSITGFVRSMLIGTTSYYVDTDGQITDRKISTRKGIGGWSLEVEGDKLLIARKKLYALRLFKRYCSSEKEAKTKNYYWDKKTKRAWKMATKGAKLNPSEMEEVCNGKTVTYRREAPTFSLTRGTSFLTRNIKMSD